MIKTLLITLLIVAICVVLLGVRIFFVKNGKFPNAHVSGNKALQQKGIGCAQSQDRQARSNHFSLDEVEKQLNENQK